MADFEQRLLYLSEILVALAGSPIPSQQFQSLADYAEFVLPHDYLGLALVVPEGNGYWLHSLRGMVAGALAPRLFGLDEGLVGQVLARNKALVTADFTAEAVPQTADFEAVCARFGLRAALAVPVRQGTELMGALLFLAKPPTVYDEADGQLATLLAAGLSASLETARMYQVLADQHSTLAAVLGSTQDAVLVVNEQGLVLLANPAVKPMLGLDDGAIVGRPLAQVGVDSAVLQLFAELGEGTREVGLPNGCTAVVSLVAVRSVYGEAIGWAAVFHDVTLFKELEQMKNDFVNIVSHDLKNPISIIKIAGDLMGRVGPLNEKQSDLNQRIRKTADYMTELISDLLDLGKIEAGLGQDKERLDLVGLVRAVVADLQTSWEVKQQDMVVSLPPQAMILADEGQVRQVLLNLIGNAIKYTPEQKTIWVSVMAEDKRVVLLVKDEGIGIPEVDLPYIFDKFYRVSNAQTKDIKGTGLGLAITKSIVEAHNGRISATSLPGEGSTFVVTLPYDNG